MGSPHLFLSSGGSLFLFFLKKMKKGAPARRGGKGGGYASHASHCYAKIILKGPPTKYFCYSSHASHCYAKIIFKGKAWARQGNPTKGCSFSFFSLAEALFFSFFSPPSPLPKGRRFPLLFFWFLVIYY